jgi:hypothetical protein
MNDASASDKPALESLAAEVRRLQERMEDREDLLELRAAAERNAGQPGVPWEQAKAELDLDYSDFQNP